MVKLRRRNGRYRLFEGGASKIRVEKEGWRISVQAWTYKRYPKENRIVADLGVIFDITYDGRRLIKASWYQAKMEKGLPLEEVDDLPRQVVDMQVYTKEAYTLLYGADEIIAVRGMDHGAAVPLSDNLVEGSICVRGDRNPLVIANTVDIKRVVTFFIAGKPA